MFGRAFSNVFCQHDNPKLQPDDKVEVFSKRLGGWIKDGQVLRVAEQPIKTKWESIPAGSVEVSYADARYSKWVLEEHVQSTLRRKRNGKLPVLLGRAEKSHPRNRTVEGAPESHEAAPTGWAAPVVGKAETRGSRPTMEDEFVYVENFGHLRSCYVAVYDGHGGRAAVDFVKQDLHNRLLRSLYTGSDMSPFGIEESFKATFAATDEAMTQDIGTFTSGCTACSCYIRQGGGAPVLYTAHVGDTRAVLCRSGKEHRLTAMSDHKPTDWEELRRIEGAGSVVVNKRVNGTLAVARALGDHYLKAPTMLASAVSNVPDVSVVTLYDQDEFIIVACDGLWDVMTDQEAVEFVRPRLQKGTEAGKSRKEAVEEVAEALVIAALDLGTRDNVTCSIIVPGLAESVA
mmetsp:Transcript_65232/g.121604  ORF Transcript_65232/g.121604 Transcript_65232/m.121604 type:complete len:402 (+) Transcript_65232:85-1290(+)